MELGSDEDRLARIDSVIGFDGIQQYVRQSLNQAHTCHLSDDVRWHIVPDRQPQRFVRVALESYGYCLLNDLSHDLCREVEHRLRRVSTHAVQNCANLCNTLSDTLG